MEDEMPTIPCPDCGLPLPPNPARCPSCGLTLTGPAAARLWEVDQSLSALRTERAGLLTQLRTPTARPEPTTTVLPAVPRADSPPAAPSSPAAPAAQGRPRWTTQQTLLAVGVLLVLVAASIALAVAWFIIGRYGQVVVMGTLTALAAWSALLLSRRRLANSAEALALVTGGLMLLDATAARRFGLLALDRADARWYTIASGLLVAALLAWLHHRDHRVAGFALLALTAASTAWLGVVALADDSGPAVAAVALVGAGVFGGLHLRLPGSLGLVRRAASGPAALWFAVAGFVAAVGALAAYRPDPGHGPTRDGLLSVVLLAVTAACGVAAVRQVLAVRATRSGSRAAVRADWVARPVSGDWRALGVVALVATAATPAAVLGLSQQVGAAGSAVLACLGAAAAVALLWLRPFGTSLGQWWAEGQAGAGLLLLVASAVELDSRPATVVALLAVSVVAASTAVLRPGWRAAAAGASALALVGAVAEAGSMSTPTVRSLALSVLAALLAGAALARAGRTEELPVGAVSLLTALSALWLALDERLPDLVAVAALLAVAGPAVAVAVLRPPARAVATGVAAAVGGWALWLAGGLVSPGVQLAAVAAVAALLVALAVWRLRRAEEPVLAGAAAVVAFVAVCDAVVRDWPHAAAGLAAAYGLVAVAYAALPHRRAVVAFGVAGLTVGAWIELAHAEVTTLEAYTVPLAVLLLAAGLWSRRELDERSWLTAGPGLAVGLLPPALLTIGDDGLVRPLVTVVVAAAVLALGAWRRWQALVVLGAIAAAVVALSELGPMTLHLPRYLTLGATGVALLALGARYEQRRADARQAVSWLASMS
jgi:hypothetical protein